MRGVFASDGRYLSLEHQRRTWEELNRIFGGVSPSPPGPYPPDPPGPDPPGPDPPQTGGYVGFMSDQLSRISALLTDPDVIERIRRVAVTPVGSSEQIEVPLFWLDGTKREYVILVTEIIDQEFLFGWYSSYGVIDSNLDYTPETTEEIGAGYDINGKLLVELLYCDGYGNCTYATNWNPSGESVIGYTLNSTEFHYNSSVGEVPCVCFKGFTAQAMGMPRGGYIGTLAFCVFKDG